MSRLSDQFGQEAARRASRDFRKGLKKKEHYGEKVRIGKSTLPMTYGDLLALKILGVMAAILLLVLLVLGRL